MRISDWSSDVCSSDLLGAALAMQTAGLSMAMGAFLAGVLLSESSFRHQLEADVEPFRGVLLGLFFLGVGMALDLDIVAANLGLIAISVTAYMTLKMIAIYAVARLFRSSNLFFAVFWRTLGTVDANVNQGQCIANEGRGVRSEEHTSELQSLMR